MPKSTVMVSGPVQWFVNVGENRTWLHLGMCENDVAIEIAHMYEGIQIDGSGRMDYDRQWMGASASISGDLAIWHEDVLDRMKVGINDSSLTPGQWPQGSIGTMLGTEEKDYSLILTSQYATKEVYAANDAKGVWYFPRAFPMPMRRNMSTRASRERTAWEALAVTDGLGAATLYFNAISFDLPVPT